MENEEAKISLEYNGEYVHDFIMDILIHYPESSKEERQTKLFELAEYYKKHPEESNHDEETKSDFHNYFIEDVKWDIARGMGCGPSLGTVNVSVKFNDGTKSQFLTCSAFDSFFYFYLTENELFNYLMGEEENNKELNDYLENNSIEDFEGIQLCDCSLSELYNNIKKSKDYNAGKLIRYVLALLDLEYEATEELIKKSLNKRMSEFYIPKTWNEIRYEQKQAKKKL